MKKTLHFIAFMLIGLLPLIMWSCSDDDENGPSDKNSIVGTWYYDDEGVEPELYTFKKDGTFIDAVRSPINPEDVSYSYGTYRYDDKNGVLQLFWEYSTDIYIVTIVGDIMSWKDVNSESGRKITLYRRS